MNVEFLSFEPLASLTQHAGNRLLLPRLICVLGACQSSCKISSQCVKLDSGSCNPDSCPYCIKTLARDLEVTDNETVDSDSEGVYEFTQDVHYSDQRDPQRGKTKGRKTSQILAFWKVVCETFRKIVDSKYFGRGIMIAILINTLSMGIEYHEQVSRAHSVLYRG